MFVKIKDSTYWVIGRPPSLLEKFHISKGHYCEQRVFPLTSGYSRNTTNPFDYMMWRVGRRFMELYKPEVDGLLSSEKLRELHQLANDNTRPITEREYAGTRIHKMISDLAEDLCRQYRKDPKKRRIKS